MILLNGSSFDYMILNKFLCNHISNVFTPFLI